MRPVALPHEKRQEDEHHQRAVLGAGGEIQDERAPAHPVVIQGRRHRDGRRGDVVHQSRILGERRVPALPENAGLVHYRSEEHTSELQSQSNLVCRLLLEKKKRAEKTISPGHSCNYTVSLTDLLVMRETSLIFRPPGTFVST